MAQEQTSAAGRYYSATDLANTKGDKPNSEAWQQAGFLKKFAASIGLAGLYDTMDDYLTGRISQQRAYDYDIQKLKEQERYQTEMWNKENTYNNPQQQLARWKAAGGNPNAFFGGGTNVGNAANLSAPSGGSGAGSTIGVLQSALGQTTDAIKSWWEARKTKAEAEGKEIENGTLWEINTATIAKIYAETDLAKRQGKLTNLQAKQIDELLPGLKGKTNAEWEKIKQETNNLIEQNKVIKQNLKYIREDTRNKILQNEKLEWEKLFRDQYGVDANSGPLQMLIQTILSGKGTEVLNTLFDYIEGKNGVDETIDRVIDTIKNDKTKAILYGNPGLAGVLYSAKVNWEKKKNFKNKAYSGRR